MISGPAHRTRLSTLTVIAVLSLSMLIGLSHAASAEEAREPLAGVADARQASSQTLVDLSTTLAEKYPTVRALVLARGDCTMFEYYRNLISPDTPSPVYSVTKSVLSILVGMAIDDGYLRLDERLSEIAPEAFEDNVDPLARDITLRDVLTKTEGFAETGAGDLRITPEGPETWAWMLHRPVKYQPSTHFRYDHVGSDLLAIVLSKAIRQDAGKFAQQRLFGPLRIANYTWPADSDGYLHGEDGLALTARDMAKIGVLYLRHGRWADKQIVSDAFVRDSTTKHNDGGPPVKAAYGYHWWINTTKTHLEAFFASGKKSQLIYVVPKLDLVVALAAESVSGGSQTFINDVVLPAEAILSETAPCVAHLGQASP